MSFTLPIQISQGSGLPLATLVILTLLVIYRKLSKMYAELRTAQKPPSELDPS